MKRAKKEKLVEGLHEKFSRAKGIVLTDFRGMNTFAMNDLRDQLREASVEYRVVKNTLMLRASQGTDMALLKEHFCGPCGVALSYEDPVTPARILVRFSEKNPALEVKVGTVDGQAVDADGIKRLSKLPSREGLLAQLLSVLNGPSISLVMVLGGVPRKFLGILQAIKKQKEAV